MLITFLKSSKVISLSKTSLITFYDEMTSSVKKVYMMAVSNHLHVCINSFLKDLLHKLPSN